MLRQTTYGQPIQSQHRSINTAIAETLRRNIFIQEKWVEITAKEFHSLCPQWKDTAGDFTSYYPNGDVRCELRVIFNAAGQYIFYRFMTRSSPQVILKGWHIDTIRELRSLGISLTKAETDLLFTQGQEIIQKHRNSTS